MNSRERVKKVLNREIPDMIPIDIGGTKCTGMNVFEYIKLCKYLGVDDGPPKAYDQFQMLARIEPSILGWFGSDVFQIENLVESFGLKNKDWKIWRPHGDNDILMPGGFEPKTIATSYVIEDDAGKIIATMPQNGCFFDKETIKDTFGDIKKADIKKLKEELYMYDEEELSILEKRAKFAFENTEYSLHGGFLKGKLGSSTGFAGHSFTEWLCILMIERDYAYELFEVVADATIENLKMYLQAVGKYIDTILISTTDFGSQRSEMVDPKIIRDIYMPHFKRMNDFVHNNSDIKTFYHSCGSIANIIEDYIKIGADILNPIQISAAGMEPKKLKELHGDNIIFWGGGVDTQQVLQYGTQQQVAQSVKENIDVFGKNGGFVFSAVHNIQNGVPIDNLVAMVDTVKKYRIY